MERAPVFDRLDHSYSQALWGDLPRIELRRYLSERLDLASISAALGSCQDTVLAFDGMFYSRPLELGRSMYEVIRRSVTVPNTRTQQLIDEVIQVLQHSTKASRFGCMHIRLSDFSAVCNTSRTSTDYRVAWIHSIRAKGFNCAATAAMVRSATKRIIKSNMAVLLLSDDINTAMGYLAGMGHAPFTSQHIAQLIRSKHTNMPESLL